MLLAKIAKTVFSGTGASFGGSAQICMYFENCIYITNNHTSGTLEVQLGVCSEIKEKKKKKLVKVGGVRTFARVGAGEAVATEAVHTLTDVPALG